MAVSAKFERITSAIEADILAGRILTRGSLASENELVKRFSVSRNTIRKSLGLLSDKGLIATRVGSGSFVAYDGKVINDSSGWSVLLSAAQARLQSRILNLSRGPMDLDCRTLVVGTDCLKVDRLRFRVETGLGVSLERSRILWKEGFDAVVEHGLVDGSITKTLNSRRLANLSGNAHNAAPFRQGRSAPLRFSSLRSSITALAKARFLSLRERNERPSLPQRSPLLFHQAQIEQILAHI